MTVYGKKVSKRIGILDRIKGYLSRLERILNYNSLIEPLILYCSITWISCCSQENIDKIFKLQKCCARIILDAQKQHSSVDLFNTSGCVLYYVESDIKRCLIAYKRISGAYPDYISELLELNSSQHSRNTRGANLNILPRRYNRAKEGGRRFSVTNSKCWNHLPLKIRSSSSVNILKNALYKQIKLTQFRDRIFTPFLDKNF